MTVMYKQCELARQIKDGITRTITWIPESSAIVGETVRLKDLGTDWTCQEWTVVDASGPSRTEFLLNRQMRGLSGLRVLSEVKI